MTHEEAVRHDSKMVPGRLDRAPILMEFSVFDGQAIVI